MPEFFLELFSEEIPARMQRLGAETLKEVTDALFDELGGENTEIYYGPRRIAISSDLKLEKPGGLFEVRGPRDTAPAAALAGFLGKYRAERADLFTQDGYFWFRRPEPPVSSVDLIMKRLPEDLLDLTWPKSMRWGQGGDFTWVRPLRRVVCLFDGKIIPVKIGPVMAGDETEGHRLLSKGTFRISSKKEWLDKLEAHKVIADQDKRREKVTGGLKAKANEYQLSVVEDCGLIDEVTGLVEWPVALIGEIDQQFMNLPPEVRELSMKVHQRYFALRDSDGNPAAKFVFVSNLNTLDNEAAIIAGNERVLRARFSDARHFWDLDRKTPLQDLLPKLQSITFHGKIGTQRARAERIGVLSKLIARKISPGIVIGKIGDTEIGDDAEWAGKLCKADLATGMVGEFPELQGIMGSYYAKEAGWSSNVCRAIALHYQPKGPNDQVPTEIIPCAVALADKIDLLNEFFKIDEIPTGSGDPYALRRAALGVGRIIIENGLTLPLEKIITDGRVFDFIVERLRVRLRSSGQRYDVLDAVFARARSKDLLSMYRQVEAITAFLQSPDGSNLLAGYRRAANILKIENAKDGPHGATPDSRLYIEQAEKSLADALRYETQRIELEMNESDYTGALIYCSYLRKPVDNFFLKVTVNSDDQKIRRNRLALLGQLQGTMNVIADFSKIEG